MKKFLKLFFSVSLLKFMAVGALNTVLSAAIMFGTYNLMKLDRWQPWGYWVCSFIAYLLTSILAFILNRRFTFQYKGPVARSAVRFALVIGTCYLIAFQAARPLTAALLRRLLAGRAASSSLSDQVSMLVGMVLFTALNYTGQRFFAFRPQPDKEWAIRGGPPGLRPPKTGR